MSEHKHSDQTPSIQASLKSLGKGFFQVGLFSLFINIIMLAPPLYMLQVYDRVMASRSHETLLLLTLILSWMLIVMGVLEFVRSRMMVRLANRFDQQLHQRLYNSIMKMTLTSAESPGARPLEDLSSIRQFLSGNGAFAFFDTPWVPIYIGILFLFDPLFGWMAVFAAGVLLILTISNEFSTRKLQSNAGMHQEKARKSLDDQIAHAEVLKSMGMQNVMGQRWQSIHNEQIKSQSSLSDRSGIWTNLSKSLRLLFQSLMLGLGAWLAINGHITAGMVIAGSIILGRALSPIDQMIGAWKSFINARAAYSRLEELMTTVKPDNKRLSLPAPKGELNVDKVVLIPPGSNTPALRGISFSLKPGETLGIIGNSAAGKSSLVRAILGLWPLANGSVRLDGAEIEQWNPEELGPHIGYLPQEVQLFEGTVAQNIARFKEGDERHIIKAAQVAGVDKMIRSLPDGYNTMIGPEGITLSGGQRQRIGLARAVYKKPRLVVLDEPNSNLDREGENALSQACFYMKQKGITLIIVSHRSGILRHMDKLLVIENGQQQLLGPREAVLQHMHHSATPLRPVRSVPAQPAAKRKAG